MYQGHHPDGSGVQLHSAGPLYPYTIVLRECRDFESFELLRTYLVEGPGVHHECQAWADAVAYAGARRLEWLARNQPNRVEAVKLERPVISIGLEASIAGQHAVGVRECGGRKTYFVVGPRADAQEFETYQQAIDRIEFLESDLYTIDLQFKRTQKGWDDWAAGRNRIH